MRMSRLGIPWIPNPFARDFRFSDIGYFHAPLGFGNIGVIPPILPFSRVTIVSQFLSVLGRWAIMRVVLPLIRSCIESRMAVSVLMPRALVGSSSIKIGSYLKKALSM